MLNKHKGPSISQKNQVIADYITQIKDNVSQGILHLTEKEQYVLDLLENQDIGSVLQTLQPKLFQEFLLKQIESKIPVFSSQDGEIYDVKIDQENYILEKQNMSFNQEALTLMGKIPLQTIQGGGEINNIVSVFSVDDNILMILYKRT